MEKNEDTQEAIEAQFKKDRQRLRDEFRDDHVLAAKVLNHLFDRKVVRRFMDDETSAPSIRFEAATKKRLNYFFTEGYDKFLYYGISAKISQGRFEAKSVSNTVGGEYYYYRFFSDSDKPEEKDNNAHLVRGSIKIYEEKGILHLNHWSHNWDNGDDTGPPEHTGYVFKSSECMYMLGLGQDVMRLAISNIPKKKNDVIIGVIVSVRSAHPHDPFGARFVMARKDNVKINSMLEKNNPEKVNNFHKITRGEYSYFMLSYHPDK